MEPHNPKSEQPSPSSLQILVAFAALAAITYAVVKWLFPYLVSLCGSASWVR